MSLALLAAIALLVVVVLVLDNRLYADVWDDDEDDEP